MASGRQDTRRESDFENRLDDYRGTTQGWKNSGGPVTKGSYAAAAASAFALAGGAEAAVIYSGVQNIVTDARGPRIARVDIDGDLVDDLQFLASNSFSIYRDQSFGDVTKTYWQYVSATPLDAGTNLVLDGQWPARLSSGNQISAGQSFGTRRGPLDFYSHYQYWSYGTRLTRERTTTRGNWPSSGTGFLGLEFERNGNTHYAWLRLQLEEPWSDVGSADKVTIVDWAWESVPGRSIEAGAVVPEPSTLTLLATGALGVHAFRKRRRDATRVKD